MSSYKTDRKDASRIERIVPICLQGNLVADWEAATRELERAQKEHLGADSKEGSGVAELADRVRALEAEMREHTDEYRLRAMPRHKFRALLAEHPPRKTEDGDAIDQDRVLGLNQDTFFAALIRASVVSPVLDDEDWAWLLGSDDGSEEGVLTDRQFGDLQDVAWFLNRGEVDVPFSHAASRANRATDGE